MFNLLPDVQLVLLYFALPADFPIRQLAVELQLYQPFSL